VGVGVEVRAAVDERDAGRDLHARGQVVPGDPHRLGQPAQDHGQDGAQPQRLVADGLQVRRVAGGQVVAQALHDARGAQAALHGPAQGGGRRLVPRDEERDELVAQLEVRERAAASSRACRSRERMSSRPARSAARRAAISSWIARSTCR
jgi:hypothetical protein